MRYTPFLILFVAVGFFEVSVPVFHIHLIPPRTEMSEREDLMGRREYERLLTADPLTGRIPEGIHQAELRFTERIGIETYNQRTLSLNFESVGPANVGGRTRAVAFDIRDENVILAGGVSGGIWKSIDGGQSWARKSDPLNRHSVSCIAQDIRPGRENIWYHGTGEIIGNSATIGSGDAYRGNGIYKSIDGGESWFLLESTNEPDVNIFNSQFQYIFDIEINEFNLVADELYAATFGGILRSLDGGENWQVTLGDKLFDLPDTADLNDTNGSRYATITQASSGVFFAALSSISLSDIVSDNAGIYLSRDGINWDNVTPITGATPYQRIVIGNSPSNPNIAYYLIDSSPVFLFKQTIFSYTDTGLSQTFELLETPNFGGELGDFDTQRSYNMMIKVHPENPDLVFVGGTNLYRSTNGFFSSDSSEWVGGYDPGGGITIYPGHHPDQHDLLFYPSNPDKMLSANDGGLRVTEDGTASEVEWESINNGYLTSQFFTIAQSKTEGDPTLIGGMQDNGTDFTTSAGFSEWKGIFGGDGGYAETTKNNSLWFVSSQRGQTLRLTLSTEFEITSFGRIDPGALVIEAGSLYLFVNPFVIDPNNENRAFFAGGNHLYYNSNISQIPGGSQEPTGIGWTRLTEDDSVASSVSAVSISQNSNTLYFGTASGQFFKLNNADEVLNFEIEDLTNDQFPSRSYISCIAVDPRNEEHILVIFSNYNVPSVFESSDGGRSFTDVSGNLEENPDGSGSGQSVRWAEIIPKINGIQYFLGTSTGLFSTNSTSGHETTWVQESPELIGSAVIPMMDYRSSDGRLAIATHGNGVFVTNVTDFEKIVPNVSDEEEFKLVSSYPNPFVNRTSIRFIIPEDGVVRIDLHASNGEIIRNLLWAKQFAGINEVVWDGTNSGGVAVADGTYYYRVVYEGTSLSGKLLLNR